MIEFCMKKVLLLLLSVGLFSLFFLMVKGERSGKTDVLQKGDSYMEGLRLVHKNKGSQDWTLTARRADITPQGDQAYLSGITMAFAGKGVTVTADKGLYRIPDRYLSVDGSVVARGENFTVIAEGAEFDSASGNLKTGGPVFIEGKKFRVKGRGMLAENSGQKVRILNDVTALFN